MPRSDKQTSSEKRNGIPTSAIRLKKYMSKINSVDDLLAQDDVNTVLSEINEEKSSITEIIVVYKTSGGLIKYNTATSNTSTTLGLMDIAKDMILRRDNENE